MSGLWVSFPPGRDDDRAFQGKAPGRNAGRKLTLKRAKGKESSLEPTQVKDLKEGAIYNSLLENSLYLLLKIRRYSAVADQLDLVWFRFRDGVVTTGVAVPSGALMIELFQD